MIADFFTTTYTTRRAQWLTDGDGNSYSALAEDGTSTYSVRAVQRNAIGDNRHLEVIVELDEVTPDES